MLAVKQIRGLSSAGRAPALQAGGHRFDPDRLHQFSEVRDHAGHDLSENSPSEAQGTQAARSHPGSRTDISPEMKTKVSCRLRSAGE